MKRVTHRAGWIMIDPWTILKDGFIQVADGKIEALDRGRAPLDCGRPLDHGPGVLMPGLVNAHTHLELTALKNKTDTSSGFMNWVQSVITQRDIIGTEELLSAAEKGMAEILNSGTLFIGDISSLGVTRRIFKDSAINGVWFKEQISPADAPGQCARIGPLKKISVSGHAPHTTPPSVLIRLKQETRQHDLPFSIHLGESSDEIEFLSTGKGPWADFLNARGIDTSQWRQPSASPVQYADRLGILDEKTIAVHLIHASETDFQLLSQNGVKACVCPRSNMKLHGRLPDLCKMLDAGIRPCLGTDSLASNDSLSILDEMQFIAERFPDIAPEKIITMATLNGSIALGMGHISGSLHIGKTASLIYVPVISNNPVSVLEKLIHQDFEDKVQRIHHEPT
jgi:cytosine/adenosine deaminase-related metal-dependent hydrolase